MKRALLSAVALGAALSAGLSVSAQPAPAPKTLDELLEQVRNVRQLEAAATKKREDEFLANRDRQRQLLEQARARLEAAETRGSQLQKQFDDNERRLAELEATLAQRLGTMGELFGAVRQVAGDAKGVFDSSLVSAQIPGRQAFMSRLAESRRLPETPDLEQLWFELLREATETGKVAAFKTPVILPDGSEKTETVVRVGVFNVVAGNKFLRFLPESQKLFELTRQPQGRFQSMARELSEAKSGEAAMALDPSRGVILGLIVQTPSFKERLDQGGAVGYTIVLLIAPLGLLICLERFIYLGIVGARVNRQLRSETPNKNNPLGRVMAVFMDNRDDDIETLQLKLDEAVLKDVPKLERGLPSIKILAAVAPLLGLLGTVTGMIKTFQAITLFGSGDPKMMAAGISEALVTTVEGLVTAIPLVLLHALLTSRSNRLVQILDEQSAGFVAEIAERRKNHG
jgi:biopolymer transport protein ExbB